MVTLPEKQKEVLEKYGGTINEMHSIAEHSAFRYGCSLAVQLMIESVSEKLINIMKNKLTVGLRHRRFFDRAKLSQEVRVLYFNFIISYKNDKIMT